MFEPITTFLFLISMALFLILVFLQEWRIHKLHKESIESAAELAEARFEALHAKEAVLAMLNDAAIELCVTDDDDAENDGGEDIESNSDEDSETENGKDAQHDERQEPGETEESQKPE